MGDIDFQRMYEDKAWRLNAAENENRELRAALRAVESWSHCVQMMRVDDNGTASMTPYAATLPKLKHALDCPGCKARALLARLEGK